MKIKVEKIYLFLSIFALILPIFQTKANADLASSLSNVEPVIILTDYEVDNGSIAIGNEFTVKLTIHNYNNYSDAYNIVANVFSEDLNLRLVDGSVNQVYIDTIKAGQSVSFSQTFYVEEDYPYSTAKLTYKFDYSNAAGTEYSNETIITPKVVTPCKLTVNVLSLASAANVGSRSLVNVRCTNSGVVDMDNVSMKIEGNILDNQKNLDLGSLKASSQLMKDCYVNFTMEGNETLSISFEYQDKNGNVFTTPPQEYSITVNPAQSVSVNKEKSSDKIKIGTLEIKTSWLLFLIIFIIVVIILIYMNYNIKNSNGKEQS